MHPGKVLVDGLYLAFTVDVASPRHRKTGMFPNAVDVLCPIDTVKETVQIGLVRPQDLEWIAPACKQRNTGVMYEIHMLRVFAGDILTEHHLGEDDLIQRFIMQMR